ncbi:MAG: tRNA uridine-5-carboxymethylaminomethyl(34) synthesis GTPase MnmE [Alphaproteobacteria bacterium]
MDTIFALSTGTVKKSGVAVFRLSGPRSASVLAEIIDKNKSFPAAREAALRKIYRPSQLKGARETASEALHIPEVIDQALVLFFPAPHSFTGEEVVELHVHGGRAIIHAITRLLSEEISEPLRIAEPGEFTRRAFENGKMDLTEVEGLADLLHAETDFQRRQALRQMEGALGNLYQEWRETLLNILAYTEAYIDFPDEDIPADLQKATRDKINALLTEIEKHLAEGHRGELLREGVRVAILGAPNAGKSSLLNALSKREVAIVSEEAGTTRDLIEVQMDLGGYLVTLIDTAGLRKTDNLIEKEGIKRAKKALSDAALCILLFDVNDEKEPAKTLALINDEKLLENKEILAVPNKIDALKKGKKQPNDHRHVTMPEGGRICPISVKTGDGMADFLTLLEKKVEALSGFTETPSLTRTRHRIHLKESTAALTRSLDAPLLELQAEDLRIAMTAIGKITGRVDVEDLLDVIFSDFCIGK